MFVSSSRKKKNNAAIYKTDLTLILNYVVEWQV